MKRFAVLRPVGTDRRLLQFFREDRFNNNFQFERTYKCVLGGNRITTF
jgi:hypothetical protein